MGRALAVAAASVSVSVCGSVLVAPASAAELAEFSVTNFTDFHGHLEDDGTKEMGAAKLAGLAKQVNQGQEYAFVSSGDNVGGSAFVSSVSEDKYSLEALNAMGVEATAVGNHEFDKGFDDLTGRIDAASDYPLLGANVYKDGQRALESHYVKEMKGVKVAFVGTVTQQTPSIVSADAVKGLEFRDPVAETNTLAKQLKDSGEADVVVALFHEDAAANADKFGAEVDVVFGGHSHKPFNQTIERDGTSPLYVLQSDAHTKLLSDLDITFDKTAGAIKDVKVAQYDYAAAAGAQADAGVQGIVDKAVTEADKLGAKVVGNVSGAMVRGEWSDESTISNFIANGAKYAMEDATGQDVDLGVMNAGGVRADLDAGDVTYEEAANIHPFANNYVVATFTGQQIKDALESQWEKADSTHPDRVIGLSDNVAYTYDPKAPQGEKVTGVTIGGEPLEMDRDYRVAGAAFLVTGGGDGHFPAGAGRDVVDPGVLDLEAFLTYLGSDKQEVPASQTGVGVTTPRETTPGATLTVELSSLNYTVDTDPQATTAKVALGDAVAQAPITHGTASVELTVPEDLCGEQSLVVTTDAGTTALAPVTVTGCEGGDDGDGSGDGASSGSSVGAGVLGIAGLVAAVVGLLNVGVDMNWSIIPPSVRKAVRDVRGAIFGKR